MPGGMGGGGASHRTAVLSPRPKQHGRSSLGSIPSSPSLGRQRSGRYPHLQLQLLTLTLCVLGLAQMWGVGPNIGRALQRAARGASHVPAPDAHGIIAPGSGTGTGLDAAASGAGRSASAVASVNNPSSARTANEGGVAARMQAGAAWGLAAVAAGPDGSAAYNPDEWPRVYGGQAEPHSRILKRCSGSLFAPPLGPGARPAEGLVGMWLPERFNLALCDPRTGQQALLLLQPALLQPAGNSSGSSGGGEGEEARRSGRRLAAAAGVEDGVGGSGGSQSSRSGAKPTQRQLLSDLVSLRKGQQEGHGNATAGGDSEDSLSSQGRRFAYAHAAGEDATVAEGPSAATGAASGTAEDSDSSEEEHHTHKKKKKKKHKHHKHKHHKHHAEEVDEGAEAAGSSDATAAERMRGAGLGGHLSALEATATAVAAAATATAAAAGGGGGAVGEAVDPATLSIELATSRALVVEGGSIRIAWTDGDSDGEAGKPLLLAEGVWARLPQGVRCPQVPYAMCQCVGGAAGRATGSARGCGMVWRAGAEPLAGGGQEAEGGEVVAVLEVERRVPLSGPALVLAAHGDRAVVALLVPGDDVAAIARRAAVMVRSGAAFTRQLEAAVGAAYAALRPVPRAIGLPPGAPPEDKRLARKLYDIMSFNTAPSWSTPDRTPHAWKWLWDSCFHAMGMNLINHTAAWEQLKGLLECQQGDGFIPHMCGDGPAAGKPGSSTAGGGVSSGTQPQPPQQQKDAPSSSLTQPPLLAWAVWDNYLFSRDKARLEWALPRLVKLLNWLAAHRSRDKGLTYFYVHGFESGMDNSPRFDSRGLGLGSFLGTLARAVSKDAKVGTCAVCTPHMVSVDLTALVAREMAHVARMYGVLKQHQDQDHWLDRSRVVLAALAASCWSPDTRMFGDLVMSGGVLGGLLSTTGSSSSGSSLGGVGSSSNGSSAAGAMTAEVLWAQLEKSRPRGHVSELVTVAGLVPLLGGRLPRPFLEGLLQHLQDPTSFATRVPLPSVALSSQQPASAQGAGGGDMWRGPMWINMNYLVAVGLREQVAAPAAGGAGGGCGALCAELADCIMNRTISEVRRWYDGDVPGGGDPKTGGSSNSSSSGNGTADPPVIATGTVFEYYDSAGLIPPTRLARKGVAGVGGVRDYHWTAALTLRMMAERAATIAAGGPAGVVGVAARASGGAGAGAGAGSGAGGGTGLGAAGGGAVGIGGSGSNRGVGRSSQGADVVLEEAVTEILDGEEEEEREQGGGLFGHWGSGGGSGGSGGTGRGSLATWVPHKPLWGEF